MWSLRTVGIGHEFYAEQVAVLAVNRFQIDKPISNRELLWLLAMTELYDKLVINHIP